MHKYFLLFIILFIINSNLIFSQEQYELVEINFDGNSSIATSELLDVIYSQESSSGFSQFMYSLGVFGSPAEYFESQFVETDLKKIVEYYRANGFFKTSVDAEVNIDTTNKEAVLSFYINEHEQSRLNSVMYRGLDNIPFEVEEDISEAIDIDSTTTFSENTIRGINQRILTSLHDNGYMLAYAEKPIIVIDTFVNIVDVQLAFVKGNRYKISDVIVDKSGEGKNFVADDLIIEITDVDTGSYYSRGEFERAQVRLYRTELFKSVLVTSNLKDTSNNQVPLIISADIGLLNELSPEIIVNNEDNTLNVGLSLAYIRKNFFGDARKLKIGGSIALQNVEDFFKKINSPVIGYMDARIGIDQPFLFDKPIFTKLETYLTAQRRKLEYNSIIYGAKFSLNFELARWAYLTSLITYYNLEHSKYYYEPNYIFNTYKDYLLKTNIETDETKIDSIANHFINESLQGNYSAVNTNSVIGVNIVANKTNNIIFPSRGYSLSLVAEEGNLVSYLASKIGSYNFKNPLFFKVILSTTLFPSIYYSNVSSFGLKFKIGNIFTYYGNKFDIPLSQRFYTGGNNSVRGWRTRELVPPLDFASFSGQDFTNVLLRNITPGGFFILEGSIETRNRIWDNFGSAIFLDYGNTWNNITEVRLDGIAIAAGFGFRFYLDFIIARFDFGFKIYDPQDTRSFFDKRTLHEPFQFHLGIGEAF
ncbi:MAG: BamA/TamA family outer membrane protein [Ignavibacteriales bacterium]|nr:BamA/TamA family outer membrane protein [Ignavibacteriales bacterium]